MERPEPGPFYIEQWVNELGPTGRAALQAWVDDDEPLTVYMDIPESQARVYRDALNAVVTRWLRGIIAKLAEQPRPEEG